MTDYTSISIAKKLAEKIDQRIENSTYTGRKDYVVDLIRKDLREHDILD